MNVERFLKGPDSQILRSQFSAACCGGEEKDTRDRGGDESA
jgi:hypothetical protein